MLRYSALAVMLAFAGCQIISGIDAYEPGAGSGGTGATGGDGGSGAAGAMGGGGTTSVGGGSPGAYHGVFLEPDIATGADRILGMARHTSGDPVVIGTYGGHARYPIQAIQGGHAYVARLGEDDGRHIWSHTFETNDTGSVELTAVATVDDNTTNVDAVAVVGRFTGTLTVKNNDTVFVVLASGADPQSFIAYYRADGGGPMWVRSTTGSGNVFLRDVAIRDNRVVAVGHASAGYNIADFSGGAGTIDTDCEVTGTSAQDGIALSFAASGDCRNSIILADCGGGNDGDESVGAIEFTAAGVYLAGEFSADLAANCGLQTDNQDIFIAKLVDGMGDLRVDDVEHLPNNGDETVSGMDSNFPGGMQGVLAVTGTFSDAFDTSQSEGQNDVFIAFLDPNMSTMGHVAMHGTADLDAGGVFFSTSSLAFSAQCSGAVSVPDLSSDGNDDDICVGHLEISATPFSFDLVRFARYGDEMFQKPVAPILSLADVLVAGRNEGTLLVPTEADPLTQSKGDGESIGFLMRLKPVP